MMNELQSGDPQDNRNDPHSTGSAAEAASDTIANNTPDATSTNTATGASTDAAATTSEDSIQLLHYRTTIHISIGPCYCRIANAFRLGSYQNAESIFVCSKLRNKSFNILSVKAIQGPCNNLYTHSVARSMLQQFL